ncbi:MAG: hypothetical protein RBJ76_13735 [Stenomitos frigidus ULC029]
MSKFDLFSQPETVFVGGFPLPKFGSLPEDEKEFLRQRELDASDEMALFVNLVKKISTEQNISQAEAIELVKTAETSNANLGVLVNYVSDLRAIKNPIIAKLRQKRDFAALLLRSRLDPEWLFENIDNFKKFRRINIGLEAVLKIRSLPEEKWLQDATRATIINSIIDRLPEQAVNELAEFFIHEDNQWLEFAQEALPVEAETDFVGKSSSSTKTDATKSKKKEPSSNVPTTPSSALA